MKRLPYFFPLLLLFLLVGCETERMMVEPVRFSEYEPVLMPRTQLEQAVKALPPREIQDAGKIYLWNNLLLVNERFKGVHVFQNSNPEQPVNLGFIQVPGNLDVAVTQGILYADSGVDLVAIEFSDLQNLRVTKRLKEAIPELLPPDGGQVPREYDKSQRPADSVVVGWVKKAKE